MKRTSRVALWLLCAYVFVSLPVEGAASSCPPCDMVDSLLKPCNTSLQMDTWPGTLIYQPTQAQAPCACNQNYYDQIQSCLSCQSSSSAHYSVKAQDEYELVCTSFSQPWKQINLPGQTTTTTTAAATSSTTGPQTTGSPLPPSNGGNSGGKSSQSTALSSGALAGIVVSAIALIVALSVAAYVWGRRRRENVKNGFDTQYKYNDPHRDSYAESGLPQYTGITSVVQPMSSLRVMNPDSDDEGNHGQSRSQHHDHAPSFEVNRTTSPGWRRGSFDDD